MGGCGGAVRRAGAQTEVHGRLSSSKAVNFLPIVQRELLVAARNRRQFRLRMWLTVVCTVLGALSVLGWGMSAGSRPGGGTLFVVLSTLFWLICFSSGIFLTADSISREKREGTLGLLFLTDLRGYDVVLGKLVSSSLMTILVIVGVMPVLALCVLMGGVTGIELLRVSAGLLITMFFSLSLGILVSTLAGPSSYPGVITLLILFVAGVGFPVLTSLAQWLPTGLAEAVYLLRFLSPAFLASASQTGGSVAANFPLLAITATALSLVMLLTASLLVKRTFKARTSPFAVNPKNLTATVRTQVPATKRESQNWLIGRPVHWLAGDQRRGAWCLAFAAVALLLALRFGPFKPVVQLLPFLLSFIIPYLVALSLAIQSSRFFVRNRQAGSLELLLSTPVTDQELLDGQWASLKQRYLPLGFAILLMVWVPGGDAGPYPNLVGGRNDMSGELAVRFYLSLRIGLLWFAAGWWGMYFGLHARRPQLASLQAALCGVVLPWLAWCVPEVVITAFSIALCHSRLDGKIRSTVRARVEQGHLM